MPPVIDVASPNGKNPLDRDCIVFIPGIGGDAMVDQTVEGLAYRVASALGNSAQDKTAVFFSKSAVVEDISDYKGEVATVYRNDDRGVSPVIDIYMFDYRGALVERYENRNLLIKALLLLLALPGGVSRILRAMLAGRASKTRVEKLQLLFALGILSLLLIYVVILLGALWTTINPSSVKSELTTVRTDLKGLAHSLWSSVNPPISQTPTLSPTPSPSPRPDAPTGRLFWFKQAIDGLVALIPRLSLAIVVLWAVVSLFLPPKFNLKDTISKAAVDYLCLTYYLDLGEQRRIIVGRLEKLIDEISRKSENELRKGSGNSYQRTHLFTYSFGSIVALDALFPAGRKPGRPLQSINTLVTIGCPFDFVRTLWPSYFNTNREYEINQQFQWLNVYSPLDILGSNFRNDPSTGDATFNIKSQKITCDPDVPAPFNLSFEEGLDFDKLSILSSITLIGLRAHSMYWGAKREAEVNCFTALMIKMYDRTDLLG